MSTDLDLFLSLKLQTIGSHIKITLIKFYDINYF
jgi:hypothetical protein